MEHTRPEKPKKNAEKITTKHNEPQHPYFEEVLPRLQPELRENHLPSGENRASVRKTP
jgi:hypothetical protein